jgi:hypothetical protein
MTAAGAGAGATPGWAVALSVAIVTAAGEPVPRDGEGEPILRHQA